MAFRAGGKTQVSTQGGPMDKKQIDLNRNTVEQTHSFTADHGVKVTNTDNWLKAVDENRTGPHLLEDTLALQKIQRFDHERIPERVVHARGTGAFGTFRLHESVEDLSYAGVLTDTKRETPMFVRFSTVQGSRGSSDTVRDTRGFAMKFYTDEGNWDIVGNNIPVFFIQEAIKFPDVIHALKPEPHNEIPQAQTAHNNHWDFVIRHPEATHMMMWIMSDRTIPRSFRMMQGFGVNTFVLVNKEGKRHFVKFHFTPLQGVHSLVWDEALKIAGQDPDFHRKDLMSAIESGNFPKWKFGIQAIPEEKEHDFEFDVLDSTKLWPEELVPIRYVGEFELNRNVDEFFPQTEQVAFCTSHIVPGIEFSDDPLLQGRNFSYFDTQISRLGVNWQELPINRPVCPVMNHHRDGAMRHRITKGTVNYWPNRFGTVPPNDVGNGFSTYPEKLGGVKARTLGPKFKEHLSQAQIFYNSLSPIEKHHLTKAFSFELGHCDDPSVYQAAVERLADIDINLAKAVAANVGAEPPQEQARPNAGVTAKNLSQLEVTDHYIQKPTIATRKIAILVGDGFDADAYRQVATAAKACGAIPVTVGLKRQPTKANSPATGKSESIMPDIMWDTLRSTLFDAVFVPGGSHIPALLEIGQMRHWVAEAFGHLKAVGATGEGIDFVQHCIGGIDGIEFATDKKSPVETYGVVTATKLDKQQEFSEASLSPDAKDFVGVFLYQVSQHRNWQRELDGLADKAAF